MNGFLFVSFHAIHAGILPADVIEYILFYLSIVILGLAQIDMATISLEIF